MSADTNKNNFYTYFIKLLEGLKELNDNNINNLLENLSDSFSNYPPIRNDLSETIRNLSTLGENELITKPLTQNNKNRLAGNLNKYFGAIQSILNSAISHPNKERIKTLFEKKLYENKNTMQLFTSIDSIFKEKDITLSFSDSESRFFSKKRSEVIKKLRTPSAFTFENFCDLIQFYILSNIEYITDFTFKKYNKNRVNKIETNDYNQYFQNIVSRIKNVKNDDNSKFEQKLKVTIKLVNIEDLNDRKSIRSAKDKSIYAVFYSQNNCEHLKNYNYRGKENIYLLPYLYLGLSQDFKNCKGFKNLFVEYYSRNKESKLQNVKHEIIPSLLLSKIIEKLYKNNKFSDALSSEDIIAYINNNFTTLFDTNKKQYEFTLYIFANPIEIRYFLSLNERTNVQDDFEYSLEFLFRKNSKIINFLENIPNYNSFATINLFEQAGGDELENYMKKSMIKLLSNKPHDKLINGNNLRLLNFDIKFYINPGKSITFEKDNTCTIKFNDKKVVVNEYKLESLEYDKINFIKKQLPYILLLCYFIIIKDKLKEPIPDNNWKELLTNFFYESNLNKDNINKEIKVNIESTILPNKLPKMVTLKVFSKYYDPNYLNNLNDNDLEQLSRKLSKVSILDSLRSNNTDNLINLFFVKSIIKIRGSASASSSAPASSSTTTSASTSAPASPPSSTPTLVSSPEFKLIKENKYSLSFYAE